MSFSKNRGTLKLVVGMLLAGAVALTSTPAMAKFVAVDNQEMAVATDNQDVNQTTAKKSVSVKTGGDEDNPMLQVVSGDEVVWQKMLPPEKVSSYGLLETIKDDNNRLFYIVGASGYTTAYYGTQEDSKRVSSQYIIGENPTTNAWKEYVNVNNYYFPGEYNSPEFTIRYGELILRSGHGPYYYAYQLDYDSDKDAFTYKDLGKMEVPYFNSALAFNPRYRPIYAHMDVEEYLDVYSIKTEYEDSDTWIFTARSVSALRGSDTLLDNNRNPVKYEINRSTKQAWYYDVWNHNKTGWVLLDPERSSMGYQGIFFTTVNWASKIHNGFFLYPDNYAVQGAANDYKGPEK